MQCGRQVHGGRIGRDSRRIEWRDYRYIPTPAVAMRAATGPQRRRRARTGQARLLECPANDSTAHRRPDSGRQSPSSGRRPRLLRPGRELSRGPGRALRRATNRCASSSAATRAARPTWRKAYGKLTGRPGIAFVTRGPGASNAAIGIHTAQQDSTPLIVFVGQVGSDFRDREAFQEIDYRRMYGSIAKWSAQIDLGRAHSRVRRARLPRRDAGASRPGGAGAARGTCSPRPRRSRMPARVEPLAIHPSAGQIDDIRARLAAARRPLAIVGGGGWSVDACADVRRFAEANSVPVACAFRSQDLFDNEHDLYAGDVGIAINPRLAARVRDADFLLVAGGAPGRDDDRRLQLARRATAAPVPDPHPSRQRRARPGVSAVTGDPGNDALLRPRAGGHGADRRTALACERGRGSSRLPRLAAAESDAGRARPVEGGRDPARAPCRRARSSPMAPATTRCGCTGFTAIAAFAPSSRRTTDRWATAFRRHRGPRQRTRTGWSCRGTAMAAFR